MIVELIITLASLPPVAAILGCIISTIKQKKNTELTCEKIKQGMEEVKQEIVNTKEYQELKSQLSVVYQENIELKKKLNRVLTLLSKVNHEEREEK